MTIQAVERVRVYGSGICLIAAPVLLAVCDVLSWREGVSPAWASLLKIWAAVTLVAVFGIARGLRDRMPLTALIGFSLTVVGLMNVACVSSLRLAAWSIAGIGLDPVAALTLRTLMAGIYRASMIAPLPGPAFPAGLIVFAWGLFRANRNRSVTAAALAVAGVLFPIARIMEPLWAFVLGDAALIAALVPLGWILLRDELAAGQASPAARQRIAESV